MRPPRRSGDSRRFVRQALENKPLTVFGDGSQTRSFCYVDDLIRGLVPARDEHGAPARQPRQPSRVYDSRARGNGHQGDGVEQRDRLRGAAGRRPAGAPARHHPREADSRLGARDRARGRAADECCRPWSGSVRKRRPVRGSSASSAALAAPSAQPSRGLIVGIFDEQSSLGRPDWAFPQYESLGVEALRVNLYWGGPSGVARKQAGERGQPGRPGLRLGASTTRSSSARLRTTSRSSSRSSGRRPGRSRRGEKKRRTARPPG